MLSALRWQVGRFERFNVNSMWFKSDFSPQKLRFLLNIFHPVMLRILGFFSSSSSRYGKSRRFLPQLRLPFKKTFKWSMFHCRVLLQVWASEPALKKTGPKPRLKVEQLLTWVTCKKNTENKTTKGLISITIVDLGTNWKVFQFLEFLDIISFSLDDLLELQLGDQVGSRIEWPGAWWFGRFCPIILDNPPSDGHQGNKSSSSPSFPKVPTNNAGRFNFSQDLLLANEPHKRLETSCCFSP